MQQFPSRSDPAPENPILPAPPALSREDLLRQEIESRITELREQVAKGDQKTLQIIEAGLAEITNAMKLENILLRYSYRREADGSVSFTLPKNTSHLDLWRAANEYASKHHGQMAADPGFLAYAGDKSSMTTQMATDTAFVVKIVEKTADATRAEDQAALEKNDQTIASFEAAASAFVLHYCAAGEHLGGDGWVRTATPNLFIRCGGSSICNVGGPDEDLNVCKIRLNRYYSVYLAISPKDGTGA